MWSVHGGDDEPLGFLFGSLHVDRLDAGGFDRAIEDAFEASQTLIVEEVPGLETRGPMPVEPGWEAAFSSDDAETIREQATAVGVDPVSIAGLPAWVARILLVSQALETFGFSTQRAFEWHYLHRAAERDLRVLPLETAEEHTRAVRTGGPKSQADALAREAREILTLGTQLEELHAAYRESRDVALATYFRRNDPFARALFDEREPVLAERLAEAYGTGLRPFAIVGVGHLVGEHNLRDRLAAFGLTLRRQGARGRSGIARMPVVARPPADLEALPTPRIEFPPNVEEHRDRSDMRRLTAQVGAVHYTYSVSAIRKLAFAERVYGDVHRGLASSGTFVEVERKPTKLGGERATRVRYEDASSTLFITMLASDGFLHVLTVVGPSQAAPEVEERFEALRTSFR